MTEIDYKARVAKGIALLDEKRPGWADQIDLGKLDIQNGSYCVTAQLSGTQNWYEGMQQLGLTQFNTGTYVSHGFNAEDPTDPDGAPDNPDYHQGRAYAQLNELWRAEVARRQDRPEEGTNEEVSTA